MGKKSKVNTDRRERFSRVRKVIRCSCGRQIDVHYRVGVSSMMVVEYRAVEKGREFTCSQCGVTHDARKEGKIH